MSTANVQCCDAGDSSVDSRRPKFQDQSSLLQIKMEGNRKENTSCSLMLWGSCEGLWNTHFKVILAPGWRIWGGVIHQLSLIMGGVLSGILILSHLQFHMYRQSGLVQIEDFWQRDADNHSWKSARSPESGRAECQFLSVDVTMTECTCDRDEASISLNS